MTLLEYVTSLQDQGLSDEEVFAKAQEWKKKNQPKIWKKILKTATVITAHMLDTRIVVVVNKPDILFTNQAKTA